MKLSVWMLLAWAALAAWPLSSSAQTPAPGPGMIVVQATAKTTDEVVAAVEAYADDKGWAYLGADKVGPVTLMKICIPEIGQQLWPLGLQISALLPCGNLSVYRKEGRTEIALLHPAYMQALYPHPSVQKAVSAATPLLTDMLKAIAK